MSRMTAADGVEIDLGESRDPPEMIGRPLSPRRRRGIGVLLAVAAIATVGPTPAANQLIETRVPAKRGDYIDVAGDRLYVTASNGGQAGFQDRAITAYRLPGGERLWRVALRISGEGPTIARFGSAVVAQAFDRERGEVIVIDEASGAILWRRPATVLSTLRGPDGAQDFRLVLRPVRAADADILAPETLSIVDLTSGEVRWSYRSPPDATSGTSWNWNGLASLRLVTGLRSGRAEVRDLATGRLLTAAVVRPPVPADADREPWLTVVDDLLLVTSPGGPDTVSAYGIDRLEHRWTARWVGKVPRPLDTFGCGALLCARTSEHEVVAVERDTGRIRWRAGWDWLAPAGNLLLAGKDPEGVNLAMPAVLLDPATGSQRLELGGWDPMVPSAEGEEAWFVVRRDEVHHRAWLGMLDPSVPQVRLLGVVSGVNADCRAGSGVVACQRTDGSIGIWRHR